MSLEFRRVEQLLHVVSSLVFPLDVRVRVCATHKVFELSLLLLGQSHKHLFFGVHNGLILIGGPLTVKDLIAGLVFTVDFALALAGFLGGLSEDTVG